MPGHCAGPPSGWRTTLGSASEPDPAPLPGTKPDSVSAPLTPRTGPRTAQWPMGVEEPTPSVAGTVGPPPRSHANTCRADQARLGVGTTHPTHPARERPSGPRAPRQRHPQSRAPQSRATPCQPPTVGNTGPPPGNQQAERSTRTTHDATGHRPARLAPPGCVPPWASGPVTGALLRRPVQTRRDRRAVAHRSRRVATGRSWIAPVSAGPALDLGGIAGMRSGWAMSGGPAHPAEGEPGVSAWPGPGSLARQRGVSIPPRSSP